MPKREPLYPHIVVSGSFRKSKVTKVTAEKPHREDFIIEKPYRGIYYCDKTDAHPYGEIIQVSTRLENSPCPYCGKVMTYGKYW